MAYKGYFLGCVFNAAYNNIHMANKEENCEKGTFCSVVIKCSCYSDLIKIYEQKPMHTQIKDLFFGIYFTQNDMEAIFQKCTY